MKIKPFAALRPPKELADLVASVPYDVVDTDQARVLAGGNDKSFLHVVKPEIDLPEGTDLYADVVYEKAAANFKSFQDEGLLVRDAKPCIYVYRQELKDHSQTGLVVACHRDDYENEVIKKHEKTLKKKEDDRTRHVKTLRANAGPVFLMYRGVEAVNAMVADAQTGTPDYDFIAEDNVRHTAWVIEDTDALVAAFDQIPFSYVADGHHRSASASRVGMEMAAANPNHTGDENYNWFLTVLFPAEDLQVLAYNRLVTNLNDLSAAEVLARVGEAFTVEETSEPLPDRREKFCMYLDGKWYALTWETDASLDPVARLDVSVLQNRLLQPILGVDDVRTDPRMIFKGGFGVTDVMKNLVDAGTAAVAFSLYPVGVDQVMDVADAGEIMPPKSTWFEPKLRSGLFVHTLD
ncbi:MAG: hypothetical protein ACI97B_004189 [Verrucomicrobiales bacterium]|jgi:uncharacterized protein (DUF1015 family)